MRPRILLFALPLALAAADACAQVNPFPRQHPGAATLLDGRWNGVNLERRTNCTNAQNNGNRGTYAEFSIGTNPQGNFAIDQFGITGLTCEYHGTYAYVNDTIAFEGTYSCSDGKSGSFRSDSVVATPTFLHLHFATQLSGSETCRVEAVLGLVRFPS